MSVKDTILMNALSFSVTPITIVLVYVYLLTHVTYLVMKQINKNQDGDDDDKDDDELRKVIYKKTLYTLLLYVAFVGGVIVVIFALCYGYFSMNYDDGLKRTASLISKWLWDDGKNKSVWISLGLSIIFTLGVFAIYVKVAKMDYLTKTFMYVPKLNEGKDDENVTEDEYDTLSDITKQKNQLVKFILMFVMILLFFCLGLFSINTGKKECYMLAGLLIPITAASMVSFRYKYTIPIVISLLLVVSMFSGCF